MCFADGVAEKCVFTFLCSLLFCVELRLISKSLYFVLYFMGATFFGFSRE